MAVKIEKLIWEKALRKVGRVACVCNFIRMMVERCYKYKEDTISFFA
jgi:hypothetical protein